MRVWLERVGLALLTVSAIWLPQAAVAAEYTIGGLVYGQIGYEDNVLLSETDEVESGLGIVAGEVNLRVRTPALEFGIDGTADIYRYADASDLDTDNQFIRGFFRGTTPRAAYDVEASFRRDSDQVDQFSASGRELDTDRRETIAVAPSFSYRLTRLDRIVTAASYQRQTYPSSDQVDSDLWGGILGWRRQATRRITVGGQISTSIFNSDEEDSIQISPQLYLGYELEDRADLSLSFGPSWIRNEQTVPTRRGQGTETSDEFGYSIDGQLEMAVTRSTNVSFGVSRGLDQNGEDGTAVESTRVNAFLGQRLTGSLELQLSGTAQRRSGLGDNTGDDLVDVALGPQLLIQLNERAGLSLGYTWRYRNPDDDASASSNAIFMRMTYVIPPYRVLE